MLEIEKDLEVLCKLAKECGATNAVSFDTRDVVVDERVRLKCRIPVCDDYGVNLMCPPYVMSIPEFRRVLTKFSWAIPIQIDEPIPDEMTKKIGKLGALSSFLRSQQESQGFLQCGRYFWALARLTLPVS